VADAIDHGTRHAEAGRTDAVLGEQKCDARLLEAWKRGGLVDVLANRLELATDGAKQPEMSFGAADIPG